MRAMTIIDCPSPNFDERALPVSMIVLHYTGMPDAEGAIDRLRSPDAGVSAHYVVKEDGDGPAAWSTRSKRAWHAGKSYWRGITDVNSASVGIEIVNPGHEFGYRPFPDEQIAALIPLVADDQGRATASAAAMSSAIRTSPRRARRIRASCSRGRRSPSAASRLPSPTRDLMDPYWTDAGFLLALERFGYDVSDALKAAIAFQRRFRPELIDGIVDGECRAKLLALLLPRPQ